MMKSKPLVLIILVLALIGFVSAEDYQPLELEWMYPIKTDDIKVLDLDKDGFNEIYASSIQKRDSCVYTFNEIGKLEKRNCVPKFSNPLYPHADENIKIIYVDDLDSDGILDICAASKIIGTAVNINKVYGIRREYEPGIGYRYKRKWEFTTRQSVTSIFSEDINNNGIKEFIVSSLDFNVYIFNKWGGLDREYTLESGVWDIYATKFLNSSAKIVAGSLNGVSLIDYGGVKWTYPTDSRISEVYINSYKYGSRILAISENSDLYMLSQHGRKLWQKHIPNLVDSLIGDLNNDGASEIIVGTNNKIIFLDDNGNVEHEQIMDDDILSIKLYNNKLYIGCNNGIYVFKSNPDFFINRNAEKLYSIAYQYYVQGKYELAKKYAEISKRGFSDVNNEDGIQRCNFILSAVGTVTTVMDLVEIANDYFAKSRKFFDKADYERAELYAKMALDIYVNVGNADNAIKCDEFLQEIRERINEIKRDAAYQYYSTAIEFLEAGLFENATESATRARTIYLEINDDEGISQCNSLIQEIINRGCLVQADEFYSMAEDYYNSGMYENSSTYAEIAFGIYSKINNSNGMEKSALLRDKSQKYLDAGIYLELAQKYFSEGNYDNATKQVEMAKSIYSELNDPERIADCDSLVSKIEEKKLGSLILNVALFFFVIAIVVILLLVFFRGSKHKKPEETKVESQGSAESK